MTTRDPMEIKAAIRDNLRADHRTMFDLLDYPNPEGLHAAECRHRDFERALVIVAVGLMEVSHD